MKHKRRGLNNHKQFSGLVMLSNFFGFGLIKKKIPITCQHAYIKAQLANLFNVIVTVHIFFFNIPAIVIQNIILNKLW